MDRTVSYRMQGVEVVEGELATAAKIDHSPLLKYQKFIEESEDGLSGAAKPKMRHPVDTQVRPGLTQLCGCQTHRQRHRYE